LFLNQNIAQPDKKEMVKSLLILENEVVNDF